MNRSSSSSSSSSSNSSSRRSSKNDTTGGTLEKQSVSKEKCHRVFSRRWHGPRLVTCLEPNETVFAHTPFFCTQCKLQLPVMSEGRLQLPVLSEDRHLIMI